MRRQRPPVRDTVGIVEYVRQRGSAEYPLEAVPDDFSAWRRAIRTEAKRIHMRVSVLRVHDIVIVHDPNYEPSRDVMAAAVDVMGSLTSNDGPPLTFEEALHRQRRRRLRVVREDETEGGPAAG